MNPMTDRGFFRVIHGSIKCQTIANAASVGKLWKYFLTIVQDVDVVWL